MDLGLKGKCAIVTGATRGIGRAIAEQLVKEGCAVAICARQAAAVATAVSELKKLGGAGAQVCGGVADVASRGAVDAWVAASVHELGGIDIVVANVSALAGAPGEDSWRAGMEIDVLGTVRTVECALPHLEKSSCAAIVAVSSTAALEAFGGPRAYNAVKAAVINYVSNLATQLAPKNIRANTVSPGTIYFDDGVWGTRKREMPEIYAAALAHNPMGRMGTPTEVANAVVFVASPAASFMTGANLVVDGGFTRRVQY